MIDWLTETVFGKFISTFAISMVPVVELRLGLPYGIAQGLAYPLAWLRRHWAAMDGFITRMERKADTKGETVRRYGFWGLIILVAIPLPGTGAWTGALVAAFLNLRLRDAIPAIFIGVCIAAAIMTGVTFGVIHAF